MCDYKERIFTRFINLYNNIETLKQFIESFNVLNRQVVLKSIFFPEVPNINLHNICNFGLIEIKIIDLKARVVHYFHYIKFTRVDGTKLDEKFCIIAYIPSVNDKNFKELLELPLTYGFLYLPRYGLKINMMIFIREYTVKIMKKEEFIKHISSDDVHVIDCEKYCYTDSACLNAESIRFTNTKGFPIDNTFNLYMQ